MKSIETQAIGFCNDQLNYTKRYVSSGIRNNTRRLFFAISIFIYSLTFICCGNNVYDGFYQAHFNFELSFVFFRAVIAFPFIVIPLFFWNINDKKVYSFMIFMNYLFMYIPGCLTMAMVKPFSPEFAVLLKYCLSCCISLCLLAYFGGRRLIFGKGRSKVLRINNSKLLIFFISFSVLFFVFFKFHAIMKWVSFYHVYKQRAIFAKGSSYLVGLALSCITVCLVPIFMSYGCLKKRISWIVFSAFLAVFVYMITAMKSTLLSPLIIWIIFSVLSKFKFHQFLILMMIASSFILVIPVFFDSPMLSGIVFRSFYVPGSLVLMTYIKYIMHHTPFYWSKFGFINYISGSNITLKSVPYTVTGAVDTQAYDMNAGIFISGVVNFGCFLGPIVVYSILQTYIFYINSVVNAYKENYSIFFICVFFIIYISFLSSAITSVLVSGGGIMLLLMLKIFLMSRNDIEKKDL